MKIHEGWYEAHPYAVRVLVCTDRAKAARYLKSKKFCATEAQILDATLCDGVAYRCGGNIFVGVYDKKLRTLVHELIHTAHYILKRAGIKPTSNDEEALTYLTDDLFGRIIKEK